MEPPDEWRVTPAHNMEHLQAIRKHRCTEKKKKEDRGGGKPEHSYRQRGEAAFLRGQHLNRAGRAGAKEAGNWGRRAAVIANSLC